MRWWNVIEDEYGLRVCMAPALSSERGRMNIPIPISLSVSLYLYTYPKRATVP